ncbi:HAD family phosphatase [Gordonia sp. Z-3]|uniref:HAD family phosphatase n=1 Tax=Gordonia aquimaris TaxID=2984863 RepID=A0A9X3I6T8_9ACTN|nr:MULTISPECIES: HAD family phosphatase [Gordonia]MCX2966626.1 HAD family phosphatase [Gordonia aquimaris]MED5803464.1 HAD family phosphatase [Gordonia sp. Z-3]
MSGPAAVLWDMDGTLLDSEPLWDVAMADLALRHGITMSPALRESTLGNALPDALSKVYAAARIPAAEQDRAGDERWLLDHVAAMFDKGLPWRPGADAALELVRSAGLPMVLVTNTVRELTDVALETLDATRFVATVCGDEVALGKPHPDPYLRAASLVGLRPDQCLAVEDSPAGTAAATAAGCPTLVIPSAARVPQGSLRSFRRSLVGLTIADVVDAWTGQHPGHLPAGRDMQR